MLYLTCEPRYQKLLPVLEEMFSSQKTQRLDYNPDPFAWAKTAAVCVLENPEENRVVMIDEDGTLPFMISSKYRGIVSAQINDTHSAKMTREHNGANIMCIGAGIAGESVLLEAVRRFAEGRYAGGRHQIRIDMLNRMGEEI